MIQTNIHISIPPIPLIRCRLKSKKRIAVSQVSCSPRNHHRRGRTVGLHSMVLGAHPLTTEYIYGWKCTHHNIQSDLMGRGRECQIHVGEVSLVSRRDARNVWQWDEHLFASTWVTVQVAGESAEAKTKSQSKKKSLYYTAMFRAQVYAGYGGQKRDSIAAQAEGEWKDGTWAEPSRLLLPLRRDLTTTTKIKTKTHNRSWMQVRAKCGSAVELLRDTRID